MISASSLSDDVDGIHKVLTEMRNLVDNALGAVKTFPPRGIKDSPPYMHDGRLLTLDDSVEFFNLVLGTKLTGEEKSDLVAFLRTL